MTLAAGASLTAPIVSLFFATFAANKVQGFALSKFGGVAGWTVMLGWFVPMPLQLVIGVFPPFWMSKAYWMILEGNDWWWATFVIGVVTQLVLIAVLMRRFETAAHQS
jgi:fluoroquinolone transport system permease protein